MNTKSSRVSITGRIAELGPPWRMPRRDVFVYFVYHMTTYVTETFLLNRDKSVIDNYVTIHVRLVETLLFGRNAISTRLS